MNKTILYFHGFKSSSDSTKAQNLKKFIKKNTKNTLIKVPNLNDNFENAFNEINKIIENSIYEFEPDIVFTHSENDVNNDHQIIYKASIIATRPTSIFKVKKLFSYEVLSSSEWRFDINFVPNFFLKISKNDLEIKWKAMKEYKSEHNVFPFPRSKDGIFTLAKYRGMQCGSEFAESFKLIRQFVC